MTGTEAALHERPGAAGPGTRRREAFVSDFTALTQRVKQGGYLRRAYGYYWTRLIGLTVAGLALAVVNASATAVWASTRSPAVQHSHEALDRPGGFSRVNLFSPLRHRDFRLLWAGMTISLLGDGIFLVAMAWQAYELWNAPAALSILGIGMTVPTIVFLLPAGILSDRLDRRKIERSALEVAVFFCDFNAQQAGRATDVAEGLESREVKLGRECLEVHAREAGHRAHELL